MKRVSCMIILLGLLTSLETMACPSKLCLHLSKIIGRPVLLPLSGTLLSRTPMKFIDNHSKEIISGHEEYRFLDSRALKVSLIDQNLLAKNLSYPDIYCFDHAIPKEIQVLGLLGGVFPHVGSFIIGHEAFGLKELIIERTDHDSDLPFQFSHAPIKP